MRNDDLDARGEARGGAAAANGAAAVDFRSLSVPRPTVLARTDSENSRMFSCPKNIACEVCHGAVLISHSLPRFHRRAACPDRPVCAPTGKPARLPVQR